MHKESQTISGIRSEIAPQKAWAGADEVKLAAEGQLWRARGRRGPLCSSVTSAYWKPQTFSFAYAHSSAVTQREEKNFLDYKKVLTYENKHMSFPQGQRDVYYGAARRPHKL